MYLPDDEKHISAIPEKQPVENGCTESGKEAARLRMHHVLKNAACLLFAGAGYAVFVSLTHLAVPCLIRSFTGYQCPGCGITRMFLALFRGDVSGAYAANPFLCVLLPFVSVYLIVRAVIYIKSDDTELTIPEMIVFSALFAGAIIFTVARNMT